jgi:hypothetical protein
MQKYYKIVSKFMIGNGLSGKQIDAIVDAINKNQCVKLEELKKPQNSLENILFMYKDSIETTKYYNDLLMYQPASRIGPGEILFATHSKELIKGDKGDLTVMATQQEIEVKGGIYAGRFKDDDILPAPGYSGKSQKFEQKYKGLVRAVPSGIGYSALIQGMNENPQRANEIYKDFQLILRDLFPNNPYTKLFRPSRPVMPKRHRTYTDWPTCRPISQRRPEEWEYFSLTLGEELQPLHTLRTYSSCYKRLTSRSTQHIQSHKFL